MKSAASVSDIKISPHLSRRRVHTPKVSVNLTFLLVALLVNLLYNLTGEDMKVGLTDMSRTDYTYAMRCDAMRCDAMRAG